MMAEFVQRVKELARNAVNEIHTAMPGVIKSFNAKTGRATIMPSLKYTKGNGTTIDYPLIYDVPVLFPQTCNQDVTIAYPIKSGDGCLLIVSENAIDGWKNGKEKSSNLKFDLTNAVCIPGLFAEKNKAVQDACNSDSVIVRVKNASLKVSKNGVEIQGNLIVTGNVSANNL